MERGWPCPALPLLACCHGLRRMRTQLIPIPHIHLHTPLLFTPLPSTPIATRPGPARASTSASARLPPRQPRWEVRACGTCARACLALPTPQPRLCYLTTSPHEHTSPHARDATARKTHTPEELADIQAEKEGTKDIRAKMAARTGPAGKAERAVREAQLAAVLAESAQQKAAQAQAQAQEEEAGQKEAAAGDGDGDGKIVYIGQGVGVVSGSGWR